MREHAGAAREHRAFPQVGSVLLFWNDMAPGTVKFLSYKRSRFSTQLPIEYRYSPSHYWLAPEDNGFWRVGLTRFATRMLGEMVDYSFDLEPGGVIESGQILGWIEGFKAISDIYCVAEGTFVAGNPVLKERITLVNKDPYNAGWLYRIEGVPDTNCVDVHDYYKILDKAIDKILENQSGEQIH